MNCLTGNAVEKANAVGINAAAVDAATYSLETTSMALVSKVVALGTDGAAVMQGRKGGVVALMKKYQPSVLEVYCLAHRLELALKKHCKEEKKNTIKELDQLLLDLYILYHYSALNRCMLNGG